MPKFQLASGKKISIEYASIDNALNLLRAILIEAKKENLDLKVGADTNLLEIFKNNQKALLSVLSSETVLEATKDCCSKVRYEDKRFSMDIFDDVENRKDFIGLMVVVALENLNPFFPQVRTVLETIQSLFLS